MANELKYTNVDWAEGTPIEGERLATNGRYTGEHKGTPMQDAKNTEANTAHCVESATVHLGTIMQDAADRKFPNPIISI